MKGSKSSAKSAGDGALSDGRDQLHCALIVDDDEDTRVIFGAALEAAGFDVLLARDGDEAVTVALRHLPKVILLDIIMPVKDGLSALRDLRRELTTCRIPVLAVSAAAGMHIRGVIAEAGFDAVLFKPIAPRDLVAAAKAAVAMPRRPAM